MALVVALIVGYLVQAGGSGSGAHHDEHPSATATDSGRASGAVALSSLPSQARQTITLIRTGGPFPYPHNDGVVFHNYEHVLPDEPAGYYHEYTVPTPGSGDRGARRIVTGKDGRFWYTGDHYDTFRQVAVSR